MIYETIAERLAAQGVGVWKTLTAYTPNEVGIYIGEMPDTAQSGIKLDTYLTAMELEASSTYLGVQVIIRSPNSFEAIRMEGDVIEALHSWEAPEDGVQLSWLQSSASVGPDTMKRYGRSLNFYLITNHFARE